MSSVSDSLHNVVPVLEEGAKVAEKTKGQEEKLKQFGEVLYDFMGPKANEITGKDAIKEINLLHDVTIADEHTKEYHEKLIKLQTMAKELGLLPLSAPQKPITDNKKPTDTSFVNTNPYASPKQKYMEDYSRTISGQALS